MKKRARPGWRGVLAAAVVLAWAGTACGRLGSLHWILDLASHFGLHLLVFGAAASVALAAGRRWIAAAAALLLAVVHFGMLLPLWGGAPQVRAAGAPLRVMSCNVLLVNGDHAAVIAAVRRVDPDVVGFIEVTPAWEAALNALAGEYPHSVRESRLGSFGLALVSRIPFTATEVHIVEGRPLVRVRFEHGGPFELLLAHPPPPMSAERWRSRNELMRDVARRAAASDVPVVVVGDLNCTSGSPWFARMLREGGLRDSREGRGVQPTWPDRFVPFPQIAIDHVLVGRGVAVLARGTVGGFGSDHHAVWCDVAREAEP